MKYGPVTLLGACRLEISGQCTRVCIHSTSPLGYHMADLASVSFSQKVHHLQQLSNMYMASHPAEITGLEPAAVNRQ